MINLQATNHLIKWGRTKFVHEEKLSKLPLEIMTLVPSTNNNGSDTEFSLKGRSFI